MSITNGDKLVVTKRVKGFLEEGDIIKVISTDESGTILFAFGEDFTHRGMMNHTECEEHFKKVEDKTEETDIISRLVDEIMVNSEIMAYTAFDKCTVVTCKLPNGSVIVESFDYLNPEYYNEEEGVDICLEKIADKIWELESYRYQEELNQVREMESCPCDCNNCPCDVCDEYECDECLSTGSNCNECENHKCPCHTNTKNSMN